MVVIPVDFFEMHEHFKTYERHFSPFYFLPVRLTPPNHIDCFKTILKARYSFLESFDESFVPHRTPSKGFHLFIFFDNEGPFSTV